MSLIKPDSTISLYADVEITAGQELVFKTKSAQTNYYNKRRKAQSVKCSYIRRSGVIKVEYPTNTVAKCNFISFKNQAFENKLIYARIMDYNYINNVTTEIIYEVDYFQTFMFDVKYETGLIEREHVTESDWEKIEGNPWRNDVYELLTDEDLPFGEDMLDMQQLKDGDWSKPDLGSNYVVMQIASWANAAEMADWKNVVQQNAAVALYADGTKYINPAGGFSQFDHIAKVACPYDIIVITRTNQDRRLNAIVSYLTEKLVTMEILGIYYVAQKLLQSWFDNRDEYRQTLDEIVPYQGYENKKLCRFPYQYMQLQSDGLVKEYKYELWLSQSHKAFDYVLSLDGGPMVSIAPINYNLSVTDQDTRKRVNMAERVDIKDLPQVAYTTDSYLKYVYQSMAETLSKKTTYETSLYNDMYAEQMTAHGTGAQFSDTMRSWGNLARSAGNAFVGNYQKSAEQAGQAMMDYYNPEFKNLMDYNNGGLNVEGEYVQAVYGNAKPLYAADEYVPGKGNYINCYFGQFGTMGGWYFVNRRIKDEIGKVFDNYLSEYGYKSMRVGTPHVCDYITGGSNAPHFNKKNSTYCKTSGMKVISAMKVVSDYIEAVFNTGHKFLKGDGR